MKKNNGKVQKIVASIVTILFLLSISPVFAIFGDVSGETFADAPGEASGEALAGVFGDTRGKMFAEASSGCEICFDEHSGYPCEQLENEDRVLVESEIGVDDGSAEVNDNSGDGGDIIGVFKHCDCFELCEADNANANCPICFDDYQLCVYESIDEQLARLKIMRCDDCIREERFDFKDGGEVASGWNWHFDGEVLTIGDGAMLTVSGSASDGRRIVVNGYADITLEDVSIAGLDTNQSPLLLSSGTVVYLTLSGENTLIAGRGAAGISNTNATVIIDGFGSLTVAGGNGAAGIGGGFSSPGGVTIINSGVITAIGGYNSPGSPGSGAGIGGGHYSHGGEITINGGNVTAIGGWASAGIGGGNLGYNNKVTITGGIVRAWCGGDMPNKGSGIGNGENGGLDAGDLEISGDAIVYVSSLSAPGSSEPRRYLINCILFIGSNGLIYGDVTLKDDFTIDKSQSLIVPIDASLTISNGVTLTNKGVFTCDGKVNNDGAIINSGTIIGNIPEGEISLKAATPSITSQPSSLTYWLNIASESALSVTASVRDGGALSYQWYRSARADDDGAPIDGATNNTYTPDKETLGTMYYYVIVTNTNTNADDGYQVSAVKSDIATVYVRKSYAISFDDESNRARISTGLQRLTGSGTVLSGPGSSVSIEFSNPPDGKRFSHLESSPDINIENIFNLYFYFKMPEHDVFVKAVYDCISCDFQPYVDPADCENEGEIGERCPACMKKINFISIPASHDMPQDWTIKTPPSCETDGAEHKPCSRFAECGYEETRGIKRLEHVWESNNDQTHSCATSGGCGAKDVACSPDYGADYSAGDDALASCVICAKCGYSELDRSCAIKDPCGTHPYIRPSEGLCEKEEIERAQKEWEIKNKTTSLEANLKISAGLNPAPQNMLPVVNPLGMTLLPSVKASQAISLFNRAFLNNAMALSLGEHGSPGKAVRVSTLLDPALNPENLVLYAHDKAENAYRLLPSPNTKVDKHGYIHFTTKTGGDIIISDGELIHR